MSDLERKPQRLPSAYEVEHDLDPPDDAERFVELDGLPVFGPVTRTVGLLETLERSHGSELDPATLARVSEALEAVRVAVENVLADLDAIAARAEAGEG